MHRSHWVDSLGVYLELLTVAGGPCVYSLDRNASQDQSYRESDISLRCHARALPILLHPQLVSF